jgi:hypothetical protein
MIRDWPGGMPFRWQEGQCTRIGVMPRAGGEVRWFPVSACQLLHTANAFESEGRIVVDGIRTERFMVADGSSSPSTLHRWEIDLARGVAAETSLDAHPVELPRIDERRTGRRHRYVYTVEFGEIGPEGAPRGSSLRQYDVESRTSVATEFGDRYMPGEAIFVPASSDSDEDAGWVLALRYDRERDRSDLVVLDASDFGADPIAVRDSWELGGGRRITLRLGGLFDKLTARRCGGILFCGRAPRLLYAIAPCQTPPSESSSFSCCCRGRAFSSTGWRRVPSMFGRSADLAYSRRTSRRRERCGFRQTRLDSGSRWRSGT